MLVFYTPFGVSSVVCGAHLRLLARGLRGYFCSKCCTDSELVAVPRVYSTWAPIHLRQG